MEQIYEYLNGLEESHRKALLEDCFYIELKIKKEGRHKEIFCTIPQNFIRKKVFELSKLYLDEYASESEKKLYYNLTDKYRKRIPSMYRGSFSMYKKVFDLFLEDKCFGYDIVEIVNKFNMDLDQLIMIVEKYASRFADSNERAKYLAKKGNLSLEDLKYKYYSDVIEKKEFNYQSILTFSNHVGKSFEYILKMGATYYERVLKVACPESISHLFYANYKMTKQNKPIDLVFIKLEHTSSSEDIINLLKYSNVELEQMYLELDIYVEKYKRYLNPEARTKVKEELKRKIDIYANHLENELMNENSSHLSFEEQEAIMVIMKFLKSNLDKNEFCQREVISHQTFINYLKIFIKCNKTPLSIAKKKKLESVKAESIDNISEALIKIIDGLKNGVIENDKHYKFELLDYYRITKIPLDRILELSKRKIPKNYYPILLSFVIKHRNEILITDVNKEAILNERIILDIEFDDDNNPILDSGREITEAEKLEVLNELTSQGIPLYYRNYMIYIRRKYSKKSKKIKKK